MIIYASFVAFGLYATHIRDTTGLSDTLSPEQKAWTKGLKDERGLPCCDDADGIDPQWEIEGDHYKVFHKDRWLIVEPGAVLRVKNRLGVARAWVGWRPDGTVYIRCFLPGPTI